MTVLLTNRARTAIIKLKYYKYSEEKKGNLMSLFKEKTLMITGGTGSFGNAVLNRFLEEVKEKLLSVPYIREELAKEEK